MKRFLASVAVVGLVFAMTMIYGQAQGRRGGGAGGGGGFSNLQVLPSDIECAQLIALMQRVEAALGVDCAYCHVFNGRGAAGNDMASDDKPTKNVARAMMRMVGDINMQIGEAVAKPADEVARVGCITCHRGSAIPMVEEAPAAD